MPNCPICQAAGTAAFMAGAHRMFRCVKCRTAFVHPVPTVAELDRFYATFHLADQEGGCYDAVEPRMQADFPAKIQLVKRFSGQEPIRLLDVGCGKGFFIQACLDHGIEAEGVDLSSTAIEHAVKQLGVKAVCGQFHRLREQLGQFDIVTFWATIEHLAEPLQMLQDIHASLRPGGHVLLSTGIGDDWLDRTLPGRVQWYDPPQHLFVFSAGGLTRVIERAGFEVRWLDRSFERSAARRATRAVRNVVAATLLRGAATLAGLKETGFVQTRFPLGNHIYVAGQRA